MQFTKKKIIAIIAATAVLVGGVVWWQSSEPDADTGPKKQILTGKAERKDLRDELTITGKLRREEIQEVNSPFDGRVSQVGVEDGQTVEPGDVLLALDGRPSVAANGDFSFYRQLDVGSDGPDVLQLERILAADGFSPGSVDRLYTESTRTALRDWQVEHGYGGATPEPVETVRVTLADGNGYTIGEKDTSSWKIGPSVPGGVPAKLGTHNRLTFAGLANQTPALPRISVPDANVTMNEGETITIVLEADFAPTSDTQVNLTFGGDMTGGDLDDHNDPDNEIDFLNDELEDSPILWQAGETTYELELRTFSDDLYEDEEEWTIEIATEAQFGEAVNYNPGSLKLMTVKVLDTSVVKVPTFTLFIDDDDDKVDEGGSATYTISSSVELSKDVEINYTVGGTADEIDDYDEQDDTPTFTFAAGSDETTLTIATTQDEIIENDETLVVRLLPFTSDDDEYKLGSARRGTVTIEDEDLPELTLEGDGTIGEGGNIVMTIEADEAPVDDVSVDYEIDGSASMGADFNVLTGTVTLLAGHTSVQLIVETLDDDVLFYPSDLIIADWPARVGTVFVDEGETVQLGQVLLNLTEPDFTIALSASPSDRSKLEVGMAVTVEIEAGDQSAEGVITVLDDVTTVEEGGAESYEGEVDITKDLMAVDGASVTIDVVLEERLDALVVPRAAVSQDGQGNDVVKVVDPKSGKITTVIIKTGLQEGSFAEVLEGLEGGETIIVDVTVG